MAITPASDIVLDVARAADPDKYRAAFERLARLRAAAAPEEVFMPSAEPPATHAPAAPEPAVTSALHGSGAGRGRSPLGPYGQFEAFVLQSFLESMLPKNATAVFGKGSAGEFWRSMLAEKLGTELARSGQVGIAQRLASVTPAATPPVAPAEPNEPGAIAPPVNPRS